MRFTIAVSAHRQFHRSLDSPPEGDGFETPFPFRSAPVRLSGSMFLPCSASGIAASPHSGLEAEQFLHAGQTPSSDRPFGEFDPAVTDVELGVCRRHFDRAIEADNDVLA